MEPIDDTFLAGVRVLELADELGEYAGRRLAALGADVVKIEPPGGEVTRHYGPFVEDVEDVEKSLYFWHYNLNKRSVMLDLDTAPGQESLQRLATTADVVLDARPRSYLDERGVGSEALRELNAGLIYTRISAFGDTGPWADFKGSDLVHLALGGMMMNCGYDPEPSGAYDTPPIAPQMWQAYHMGGEMAVLGIIGALLHRRETGRGQHLSTAVHDSVSTNTEVDLPNWIYNRLDHHRQTCRHGGAKLREPMLKMTKDGRWLLPYQSYLSNSFDVMDSLVQMLRRYGMEMDLGEEKFHDRDYLKQPVAELHIGAVVARLVAAFKFSKDLWKEAQADGMPWAPLRLPEENLDEEHWRQRQTFQAINHEDLGRTIHDVAATWRCAEVPPPVPRRAPKIGEHTAEVLAEFSATPSPAATDGRTEPVAPVISKRGKPFALTGVKIVDLSWMLASGGAARFLSALGADVIKVEHSSRLDIYRTGSLAPNGGRAEREAATGPITPTRTSINQSGAFMEVTPGRRSLSLNLKHPTGMEILTRLIADADMVIEGFSPGTMDRMGLGYDRLKEINPEIIYVQQSGMGQVGTLGRIRMFGPAAQAITGLSEMSGLPAPYPPAGIGYSYLDWFGAYNMAAAMFAALYRKTVTGKGCHVDSSQAEIGMWLSGTAILDYSVNGRHWSRYGNHSPYKQAAPHGAYRADGEDRWIAIACFTEEEWQGLVTALGDPEWASEERFSTLAGRLANQGELDTLVGQATVSWDAFQLMETLQSAGVPAGVCQTAEDRYENDPQLRHLEWMVELSQKEIGTWPVREFPVQFSETPAYMGGPIDRGSPNYGEDNDYVLGELLGFSAEEIEALNVDGVT